MAEVILKILNRIHARSALTSAKKSPEFFVWEVRVAPEPVWMLWRRYKTLVPAGNRNRSSVVQPVVISTELVELQLPI
jgi:hypothetical protein